MGNYKVAFNKVHRNFNRESVCNNHIVQLHLDKELSFCGTKAELTIFEDADTYIADIEDGKNMDNEDNDDFFCKKCIASVLAPGSDAVKDRKRIERYQKRLDIEAEKKFKEYQIKNLKNKVIKKFLSECFDCKKALEAKLHGFSLRSICGDCDTTWRYTVSCEIDGTFRVYIDKNKLLNYRTALGNIKWKDSFIKFSEDNSPAQAKNN